MDKSDGNEPKREGVTSKQGLYSKVAKYEDKILTTLIDMLDSRNENVRMGAAKTLLGKILPDIRAVEVSGPDGGPLQLKYIIDLAGGYIPPLGSFTPASTGSDTGSASLQSVGLASESAEDNDSTDGVGEASVI